MARVVLGQWLIALFLLVAGRAAWSQTWHDLPLVMSASSAGQQGFVRIINRSDRAGTVSIHAIDDTGRRFGPVSLSLTAGEAAQFNSQDLERGNPEKGLSGGVGDGTGDWRLELRTTLDIGPLAYIRTPDGFLTSMHEVASEVAPTRYRVPIFNPGGNRSQASWLRLINPGDGVAEVTIEAQDDQGHAPPGGEVRLSLPARAARTLSAQQLEEGSADTTGRFGDGEGKWQPLVSSDAPIQVMSLMRTRSGHLANLSRGAWSGARSIPLVMSASNATRQGFVRIINHSHRAGTVSIHAIDDSGRRFGPVSLSLAARAAAQFNSQDLERGNPGKGLSSGVGQGTGNWRLELETTLDIEPLAYIRTPDGFLTAMHEVASEVAPMRHHVPIFNPASNRSQESWLRLVNPGDAVAEVTIEAQDDQGHAPPGGEVRLSLPAGAARTLSALELEEGSADFSGRFGDGEGKWQLFVSSDAPIEVMSLMRTRSGHLANLSGEPSRVVRVSGRALLGPLAGATVTVEGVDGVARYGSAATRKYDTDLETAGSFSLELDLSELPPVVLLTARGGKDLDADNDGVPDVRPTPNRGRIHAYLPRYRLAAPFTINPLTEIAYQELQRRYPDGFASLPRDEMLQSLDEIAAKYLDGGGAYSDLLAFDPAEDRARSRLDWDLVLTGLVDALHAGAGSSEVAHRVAALSWQLDAEGTVNEDGAAIRRIEGSGEDRVVTTVLPDATGDSVRRLEQISVDATGAVVRARITKVTERQSRVHLNISHRGNTLSITGVSDILEDLEFSEAAVQGLVSRLVTLTPRGDGELLIGIDKDIASAISEGQLVFRINGKKPTAEQLDIIQDDPLVSWLFRGSDESDSPLEYMDVPDEEDVQVAVMDDNVVVKMPIPTYGRLSGIVEETLENRAEQLADLLVNVASLVTTGPLAVPLSVYSAICTGALYLGEVIPLYVESHGSSTRVELAGYTQGRERTLCAPLTGTRVRRINFHQEYHPILWMWLSPPYDWVRNERGQLVWSPVLGGSRTIDLNVNGSVGLKYSEKTVAPTSILCLTAPVIRLVAPLPGCSYITSEPLDSVRFGSVTLEEGHGYMILPSRTVTIEAEKSFGLFDHELTSASVTLWQETDLFDRNLKYEVAPDSFEPVYPNFNAVVSSDQVVLDARPSIIPEGHEVVHEWSWEDPSRHVTVFLGQGSTLHVPRSTFDDARASFRAVQISLFVTVGSITKSVTRSIELDQEPPWNPELVAGAQEPVGQDGHYYDLVKDQVTWEEAVEEAASRTWRGMRGHLVTITSAREEGFVFLLLFRERANAVWMGASDAGSDGAWEWMTGPEAGTLFWQGTSTGSAVGSAYANWQQGEPRAGSWDCAYLRTDGGFVGEWASAPCDGRANYIVEYSAQADLTVISSVSPAAVEPGDTVRLSATVRNQGGVSAEGTRLRFFRSSDSTISASDTPVGTVEDIGTLSAGGSSSKSTDTRAPSSPGTYWYGACVDSVPGESNTDNNCSGGQAVMVRARPEERPPDLTVTESMVSPSTVEPGGAVTISATLRNQGGVSAEGTRLRFFRSSDSTISASDTPVGTARDTVSLPAGAWRTLATDTTAPLNPGTYYYGACVDAVPGERSTANNCSGAQALVVRDSIPPPPPGDYPDLVVTAGASPTTVAPGGSFRISAAAHNQGGAASEATILRLYRSSDSTISTSDTLLASNSGAHILPAGGTLRFSTPIVAPLDSGTYYYGACVDSVAGERNTDNNCSDGTAVVVR